MINETKRRIASYALYFFTVILIGVMIYEIGYIKGLAEAHKTQLKEQIRLLQQEQNEYLERQVRQLLTDKTE